jgi:hypothetical protein
MKLWLSNFSEIALFFWQVNVEIQLLNGMRIIGWPMIIM